MSTYWITFTKSLSLTRYFIFKKCCDHKMYKGDHVGCCKFHGWLKYKKSAHFWRFGLRRSGRHYVKQNCSGGHFYKGNMATSLWIAPGKYTVFCHVSAAFDMLYLILMFVHKTASFQIFAIPGPITLLIRCNILYSYTL